MMEHSYKMFCGVTYNNCQSVTLGTLDLTSADAIRTPHEQFVYYGVRNSEQEKETG